ncbi:GATA-type zinc finger protein 1 isoform X2 [Aphelocoma coerulescens]|uniref:GATA-type zinc finger protein 1 isoform X2 n=1 Tax=Aphelocoma coerulescens TaxID=39617 RepID=UPI0036048565
MGEQPVFLRGEPPDFSLLRRLLCLEPEPERLLLTPGGAATTEARRTGLPEPPPRPRSPPSVPGESLGFLQEAVRLLSPPAPLSVPPAALPEHPEVSAVPTGSPDTLSLIDLQCQLLAGGTGSDNGTSTGTGSGTGSGRRRKRARPQRGADPRDPSFRGVTLRMRLALPRGDTGDCRLLVTARAHRIPTWSRGSGSSDEDAPVPRGTGSTACGASGAGTSLGRAGPRNVPDVPRGRRGQEVTARTRQRRGDGGGSGDNEWRVAGSLGSN